LPAVENSTWMKVSDFDEEEYNEDYVNQSHEKSSNEISSSNQYKDCDLNKLDYLNSTETNEIDEDYETNYCNDIESNLVQEQLSTSGKVELDEISTIKKDENDFRDWLDNHQQQQLLLPSSQLEPITIRTDLAFSTNSKQNQKYSFCRLFINLLFILCKFDLFDHFKYSL
jgi:hypothetical protein